MSYSFIVSAPTKAEVTTKVWEQLSAVVLAQPVHEADRAQAQAAAESFLALLADDPTKDIAMSVNGSIWKSDDGIQQASVSVSAGFSPRNP